MSIRKTSRGLYCALAVLLALTAVDASAQRTERHDRLLTHVLQRAVQEDGLVRYDLLARPPLSDSLAAALDAIAGVDAARLRTDGERLAFWLDAYNAHMLALVAARPDVAHVLDDGPAAYFFDRPVDAGGVRLTLDEIEHVVLRRRTGRAELAPYRADALDPRLHVGLNCAAIDCPRLPREAFTAARLDSMLDARMRLFMTDARHVRATADTVYVSSLLDWFADDFDTVAPAGTWLAGFLPPDRPDARRLRAFLVGRDAAALRADPRTRFVYRWRVARAPTDP